MGIQGTRKLIKIHPAIMYVAWCYGPMLVDRQAMSRS
jgi:hypothetical protein